MDLTTKYLGLNLRNPIVPSASPLSADVEHIRQMEDAGASAVVLYSLFEEQVESARADAYLRHIQRARESTNIPIIASLNTSALGTWTVFARRMQQAGAHALELNIYNVPTDLDLAGSAVERAYVDILRAVKAETNIPVAVKISPFFSNVANMAKQLDAAGADGLVLFNRFYQPDIDLEYLEVTSNIVFSTSTEFRLPLRWIAILYGRIHADLAATSGIHRGADVLKAVLAGASAAMVCSTLLEQGVAKLSVIEQQIRVWLEEHRYDSISSLKGRLSQQHCSEPAAFERAQYMDALTTWVDAEPWSHI